MGHFSTQDWMTQVNEILYTNPDSFWVDGKMINVEWLSP